MKHKQAIFNVGGSLSTYIEFAGKKIVIDLGKNSDFSPTKDFLLPYFKKNSFSKRNGKYVDDQLIISHPHNDLISDIKNFDRYFYAELFTIPNDNRGMQEDEKINWELIKNPTDEYVKYLREKMLPGRQPPLKSSNPKNLFIYYIKSKICEKILTKDNYANNISIAVYVRINGCKILLPGDLMKDGMEYLIDHDSGFRNKLKEGVDFLVAPHHGLKSSFSTKLFKKMKNNKTKRLNIISEKPTSVDSNRLVDSRYANKNYCEGKNNLSTNESKVYQRKTSRGHIIIDYHGNEPLIVIANDARELLKKF